jgi:hypothetical protein
MATRTKVSLKPKIVLNKTYNSKTDDDEVVVTVTDNSFTVPIQLKPQPRVLHPEPKTDSPVEVEIIDEEIEMDGGDMDEEEDIEVEESEQGEDEVEGDEEEEVTETAVAPKRRTRTKKVYPPSDEMFEELIKSMCDLRDSARKVIALSRETQKAVNREMRELRGQIKKQKADKPKRKPTGFAKPAAVSKEMIDYLTDIAQITEVDRKAIGTKQVIGQVKIQYGCELARNELTSALCQHFRDNGMRKNEQDKRKIYLDDVTCKLFGIDVDEFSKEPGNSVSEDGEPIITYFDLQTYLAPHCGKNAVGH